MGSETKRVDYIDSFSFSDKAIGNISDCNKLFKNVISFNSYKRQYLNRTILCSDSTPLLSVMAITSEVS